MCRRRAPYTAPSTWGAFGKSPCKDSSATFMQHLLACLTMTDFTRACDVPLAAEPGLDGKRPAELPFRAGPRAVNSTLRQNLQASWDPGPVSDSGSRVGPRNPHFSSSSQAMRALPVGNPALGSLLWSPGTGPVRGVGSVPAGSRCLGYYSHSVF